MSTQPWWQTVEDWINPKIQKVADVRQNLIDVAGGDDSIGGAIAGGVTLPAQGLVDVISGMGRGIGGVAGAVGGMTSEAGLEADAAGDGAAQLDALLSGATGGSEAGAEAARGNIGLLDVASVGTGALGSGALKAAKAATTAGDLSKAGSLARGASTLQKADLGLGLADAGIGAGQTVHGISEGDIPEALMGVARVAGNTYGARNALKDIGESRGLRSIIDELGLRDTAKVAEAADSMVKVSQPKYEQISRLADATGRGYDVEVRTKDNDPSVALRRAQSKSLVENPENAAALSEATSFVRRLEEAVNGEQLGELKSSIDAISKPTYDPVTGEAAGPSRAVDLGMKTQYGRFADSMDRLKSRAGEFKGWFLGTEATGTSDAGKGMKRNPPLGTNPYKLNPIRLVENTNFKFDFITNPTVKLDKEAFTNATYGLPYQLRDYALARKMGGEIDPTLERALKVELFKERLVYTALHENLGHNPEDTPHLAKGDVVGRIGGQEIRNPGYYTQIKDVSGTDKMFLPTLAKTLEKGNADTFSVVNNQIFRIMNDPDAIPGIKAEMADPKMQDVFGKMYDAFQGAMKADPLETVSVPKKAGRTAGIREQKEAAVEFADEPDVSTPPSGRPPGAPPEGPEGGESFGPNLLPIAERIRRTLLENRKVNVLNNQNKSEILNLRAQALQKIDDELAAGRMTNKEATIATSKALSGDFNLEKTVAQLPISEVEKQMMTERLAQSTETDRFARANIRANWEKMLAGERLTDGEVKQMTDALNIKIEELKETPFMLKLLKQGENLIGGSRALMSSWDLSAAGRQALFASVMNPREAAKAFKTQIDALRMTPKEFEGFMDTLKDPNLNPMIQLQEAAGLHISHQKGGMEAGGREEGFINASWAEKIPGVQRSEQAYIAYLNKMRVELFNKSAKQLMDSGVPLQDANGVFNPIFKDVAYMVNTLTGRGEMSAVHISPKSGQGKLLGLNVTAAPGAEAAKNMHSALTNVFFAPRFAASRAAILRDATFGMLGGNLELPVYKMYMKNVYGTIGVMGSLAAAVVASGAGTFNTDWRKKDFGVLRVGKTRYDLFGGLKPWAKLALVLESDKYYDSRGQAKRYGGYGSKTKTGEIGRFVQGKLSPATSLLIESLTGEDFMGKKSTAFNKAYSHFTPMILQTITEAIDEGEADQLPLAVPAAVLGIGVNTYSDSRRKYQ